MGDFWATYYDQYAFGKPGVYGDGNLLLIPGQEDPRTPELGHALGFGAKSFARQPQAYYLYDEIFDRIHKEGGLRGYAHQAQTFHGYRGLTLDGLRGNVDMLEIIQYCADDDEPLYIGHYYRLLDLGFPVTAVAGSDFPWCGNDHDNGGFARTARIGNVRFYTKVNGNFTFDNWLSSVRQGKTFATTGPMLEFTVNDSLPGSRILLTKGSKLKIHATATGDGKQVALTRLDIVSHGKVIATSQASMSGQSASRVAVDIVLPATKGQWIAAVAYGEGQHRAHTTPVYISVDGSGFHNPETIQNYLVESERYLDEIEAELQERNENPEMNAWRYKKPLELRIARVKAIIENLKQTLH